MKVSNRLLDQPGMADAGDAPLQALDLLYSVIDPELGVNIVDLGLVYSLDIAGDVAQVQMTMTTPACPLGDYLSDAVESAILNGMPGIQSVQTQITFEPPWDPEMMSGAAKYQLGW
jgi:metal-sulfur cluster biosynthetic enzyme